MGNLAETGTLSDDIADGLAEAVQAFKQRFLA